MFKYKENRQKNREGAGGHDRARRGTRKGREKREALAMDEESRQPRETESEGKGGEARRSSGRRRQKAPV